MRHTANPVDSIGFYNTFITYPGAQWLTQDRIGSVGLDIVLENQHLSAVFSGVSGLLVSVTNKADAVQVNVSQTFRYYVADGRGPANSTNIKQAAGACELTTVALCHLCFVAL